MVTPLSYERRSVETSANGFRGRCPKHRTVMLTFVRVSLLRSPRWRVIKRSENCKQIVKAVRLENDFHRVGCVGTDVSCDESGFAIDVANARRAMQTEFRRATGYDSPCFRNNIMEINAASN